MERTENVVREKRARVNDLFALLVVIIVIVLDQLTKNAVVQHLVHRKASRQFLSLVIISPFTIFRIMGQLLVFLANIYHPCSAHYRRNCHYILDLYFRMLMRPLVQARFWHDYRRSGG